MLIFQITGGPGKLLSPFVSGTESPVGQKCVEKSLEGPCFVLFRQNATNLYSSLPSEAVFANSTGMLVVVFGLLVLYILLASSWKCPEPEILTERQVWGPGLPFQVQAGVGPNLEKGPSGNAWALPVTQ